MSTNQDAPAGDAGRDLRFGLHEALDGELPHETVERMRRHTADCPECAEEWEQLQLLKELVRRSCADRAPSGLRDRIVLQCRSVTVTRTGADGTSVTVTRTTTRRSGPAR
ncbi:mycothiol system anti-sigma-R factor [Brachybacterium sp. UMB0905]|uniref:mycothiol system anti-sigma-R factor n=1 Tax=Brachybacterium sp. UMB0905 TaxID=2069310 RepID=UPI000C7FA7B8|nr:mycothiol system anti-sigma-R factor [Brachybacterium sp. UMB0905]PMC76608.1 mycothiol system anti-sigma-R factor [Brachybacterium sp. UMB0905]